jgi:hypothetical protein
MCCRCCCFLLHYAGVPSHGVHVNGYTTANDTTTGLMRPHSVWIGVRSVSKATYPGLLDQLVSINL